MLRQYAASFLRKDSGESKLKQTRIKALLRILFLQKMDMILPSFELTDVGVLVTSVIEQRRSSAERNSVNMALRVAEYTPRTPC